MGAQTSTGGGGGFAPGAREIFSLNLAQEPLGDFAKPISPLVTPLSGKLEVVEKEGQRMLRSAVESEFLITLPERLPERFTLEFDLITRASGYNNYELSFEGTPTRNRGPASAQVTWRQSGVTLFGGRDAPTNLNPMPDDVQAEIEGQLAQVRVEFAGDNFTMYTNGRKIFNAPAVKFPRARVLRVGLYGFDAKQYAVHLSRLRIADAATTMPATTQQQSGIMAANTGAGGGGLTTETNPANTAGASGTSGSGAIIAITGINVSVGAGGVATVRWNPLPVSATYFVVRWNANDPSCCNAMSPPGIPLTSPGWQDGVLPSLGTYVYRVIGKTANGIVEGETRFTYTGAPTPPPGVAVDSTTTSTPPVTSTTTTSDPTAPFSSGPRTVSVYPEPTSTPAPAPTTTSTASGRTNVALVGATGTGTLVGSEPAPTTTATPTPTTTAIYVPPPTTTGTITPTAPVYVPPPTVTGTMTPTATTEPSSSISSGPGMPTSGRFRVMLAGITVQRPTMEEPLNLDGRGDEIFGAAAVLVWDRKLKTLKSSTMVQTQDYGEVGLSLSLPNRIQAGSATTKGGLTTGDRAPYYYDPAGDVPEAAGDRFPLLVWEGELQSGGDMVIVTPSVWERDLVHAHWEGYKLTWKAVSPAAVIASPSITSQFDFPTLTVIEVPVSPLTMAAPPAVTFNGQPTDGYKIGDIAFGPSNDRPIGMKANLGVYIYEERMTVVTYEKVATLKTGDAVSMPIFLKEPVILGGEYTLYLRVKRVQ